jgi:hypothetical protein
LIDLLPNLAPDAMFSEVRCGLEVFGGTPTSIEHTSASPLPFSTVAEFSSDVVNTTVTPNSGFVEISVSSCRFVITGLDDILGFDLAIESGAAGCGPLEGTPVRFPVGG